MSDEELFHKVSKEIEKTINISSEEVSLEAYEYIKNNKQRIINFFLEKQNESKKAFFMAGSPGAGKSEMALALQARYNLDIIDTDEIRRICPRYNGKNSHLFQKASSRGVDILINESYKKSYSFILDGNFANLKMQEINIDRALKRGYEAKIFFVYRPLDLAKQYTKIREEKEGRKVPDEVFYNKFLDAITTTNSIVAKYDVKLNFYDLKNNLKLENIKSLNEIIDSDKNMQDDIVFAKHSLSLVKENAKIYFNIPLEQKEQAKKLGAKWDSKHKSWYAYSKIAPKIANIFPINETLSRKVANKQQVKKNGIER